LDPRCVVNITHTGGAGRWSFLLTAIKVYTVVGPLVLVVLVRVVGFDGSAGVVLTMLGYVLSLGVLGASAVLQASAGQRTAARSSAVFAGVALIWILVVVLLLPSLAST
jgi:hypothetical protein